MRYGTKPYPLVEKIYSSKSLDYLKWLAWDIEHTQYFAEIGISLLAVSMNDIKNYDIDPNSLKVLKRAYLIDIARRVEDYPIALLLTQPTPEVVQASARGSSYNKIHLPELLKQTGGNGGGHFNACGADFKGGIDEIARTIIQKLEYLTRI